MQTPHYRVERLRAADVEEEQASYDIQSVEKDEEPETAIELRPVVRESAVVSVIRDDAPIASKKAANSPEKVKNPAKSQSRNKPTRQADASLFDKLFGFLKAPEQVPAAKKAPTRTRKTPGSVTADSTRKRKPRKTNRSNDKRAQDDASNPAKSKEATSTRTEGNRSAKESTSRTSKSTATSKKVTRAPRKTRKDDEISTTPAKTPDSITAPEAKVDTTARANEDQPSTDKRANGNREKTQRRRRSNKTDEPSSTIAQQDNSAPSESEVSADHDKTVKQSVSTEQNDSPAKTQIENSGPVNVNSAGKWGQAGNDPRVAPQILAPGSILVIAPQKPVTEHLPAIERDLGTNHSSNWNRANNDPRASRS